MKKCIIIANGKAPSKRTFLFLEAKGYGTLYCADGGANAAYKLSLKPNFIIGDFDSIEENVLKYYEKKSKIIRLKRQNDTDVEKCLKHAIKNGYTHALILGATGDRLDHTVCNLGILLKFNDQIEIELIHEKSIVRVYKGRINILCMKDEIISIYAFDDRTKITSEGLKYPLREAVLTFGKKESTSNRASRGTIELKISNGKIFIIRDFQTMVRNNLF